MKKKAQDRKVRGKCAFIYTRVSTQEQAEHRTSLDQQERDARQYCEDRGWTVVGVFKDGGISGSDRSRPELSRMLLLACGEDHPVDFIVACDLARVARDLEFTILLKSQLKRAGVELQLVYQSFEDSHAGQLHQILTSWQDEDAIIKAAANTRRGLRGTAEEGFWCGGPIPLGYESRAVELRGKKEKKKLFVREDEARVVRLIFDMASGTNGPAMGGRAIADHLNKHGYTLRGRKFFNSNIAGVLSRTHYIGRFAGNRFGVDGKLLPEDEWTWVACPSIISQEQFDRVAAFREKRAPRNVAPRIVNGPTLLVGIARCGIAGCGCGMTIRTGKGGRYRYYTCHARTNRGAGACECPSVRAEQLDELVMRELAERLFVNDRLEGLLKRVLDFSDEARTRKLEEIARCEEGIASSRRRLSVLYDGIEAETLSARDPDIAARIKSHRAEIDTLNQTAKILRQQVERGPGRITPNAVRKFGEIVRDRLIRGDQPERQQIVRAFVKQVRVGVKQVAICGGNDALAHGVAAVARSTGGVPSFDREWCPEEDSTF